jgi:hypothetical protein
MPDNIDDIFLSIVKIKNTKFQAVDKLVLNDFSREKTSDLFYKTIINKS